MKKSRFFGLGMTACVLTFLVVLAGCGKKEAASAAGAAASAIETVADAANAVKKVETGVTAPASDFTYDLTADGAGIIITGYTGSGGALVIPATIEDIPVTEIAHRVFANVAGITSVVIPDSVAVIGSGAFQSVDELTKVTLPDGLKVIPSFLFSDCNKLTSVNLPSSLESIGWSSFSGCIELNALTIPVTLTSVKWIALQLSDKEEEDPDNYAFASCGKLPIKTRQAIQAWGYISGF